MTQQKAALHPISFTLWYEHIAGINPALSEVLTERLSDGRPLTEDDVYELVRQHVTTRDVHILLQLQQRLRTLLEEAAQITADAGADSGRFACTLDTQEGRLASAANAEGIHAVVADLLSATRQMQELTQKVVEKLDRRAHQVGELRSALQEAKELAMVDPLTGLKNRRGLEETVDALKKDKEGGLEGSAFLLIDIDHFKSVNDVYGHLVGDQVLRVVARLLEAHIKGRDLAARMGGEEFAVILLDTSVDGAKAVAEQLRHAVEQGRIRSSTEGNRSGAVTVSIGLTVAGAGEELSAVMGRADAALYAAKRAGRNRVCVELA